jgi:hypothetical protein
VKQVKGEDDKEREWAFDFYDRNVFVQPYEKCNVSVLLSSAVNQVSHAAVHSSNTDSIVDERTQIDIDTHFTDILDEINQEHNLVEEKDEVYNGPTIDQDLKKAFHVVFNALDEAKIKTYGL